MVFMIFLWIKWGGEGLLYFYFLIGGMVYLAGRWDTDFYDAYGLYDFYYGQDGVERGDAFLLFFDWGDGLFGGELGH